MIDDTRSSFSRNVLNGILIERFDDPSNQQDDAELLTMLKKLANLADLDDVRH